MITDSDNIREKRLAFYQREVDTILAVLREFLQLCDANCAFLVDKDGYMVTKAGTATDIDLQGVSTLVAGSYASARAMARLLGEDEFCMLFHEGKQENIQVNLVGERGLLVTVFDERTTVGMVRLYAKEATEKLLETFRCLSQGRISQ